MRFRDRAEAGEALGQQLAELALDRSVVLGLPRGGVVVAAAAAPHLRATLDVLVVRKLGVPWHPELGMGAIAEGGVVVLNSSIIEQARVPAEEVERVRSMEEVELDRRAATYRAGRARIDLEGATAVIVDDGLATGFTARAAVESARGAGAARVIVAVPVGADETVHQMVADEIEVVCLFVPPWFMAVGEWYDEFGQTSDREVIELLSRAA
jgi:predicted phosphoribosyltransferase